MTRQTDYPGIDYSGGRSNFDPETGIHYGIISLNCLSEWAIENFESNYGDPHCPECGGECEEYEDEKHGDYEVYRNSCSDYACTTCKMVYDGEWVYGDEPVCWTCDDGEVSAMMDRDNDVWVFKSPYYTLAQFCSPCAPGAGHLEHPCSRGPKTYCLGPDWFSENPCPYPIYEVSTDKVIYQPQEES